MENKMQMLNMELTRIYRHIDEVYHDYATMCELSDPSIWVLYTMFESGDRTITQNDLVSMWSFPKQTVNYTVNSLVKKNWICLEQLPGARNRKALRLTREGKEICREKIVPLMEAEERSLRRMTEEERTLLLKLTEKQCNYFEEEVKKILLESSK